MDADTRERTQSYILARNQHPAWQLLASRRAPLVLSCLRSLFEQSQEGIAFEDAQQSLAELLAQHANHSDFEVGDGDGDAVILARRELRGWIKRALVVERDGRLYATDALEEALRFVDALGDRMMTSTASRLSVVQREIENLESRLNPDPSSRADGIRRKVAELERELAAVESGWVDVPDLPHAIEGIREIYTLAASLRVDFRRVEDSWRDADLRLRHAIVNEQNNRGAIVDTLLDGHDALLDTPEGRVFHGFQQQLGRSPELDAMKRRLRAILQHPAAEAALSRSQQTELRWLVLRLIKESGAVIRVRARSERDVRTFLKTGLAAEHHRVGGLLNDVFRLAQNVDWASQAVRRKLGPLPPVAIANSGLPLIERLRFKSLDQEARQELELRRQAGDLSEIEEEFWSAFDGLDREALLKETLAALRCSERPLSIGVLAQQLPPTHDLETIALWFGMAREAAIPVAADREIVDVVGHDGVALRFQVPVVSMSAEAFVDLEWEV